MSFLNQVGDFYSGVAGVGTTAVGTIGELIDAYGNNAVNASNAAAVNIQNAQSQIAINEAKAAAEIKAKENLSNLLNSVAYVSLLLVAALVVSNVYKKMT